MTDLAQGTVCPGQIALSIERIAGVWDELLLPYQGLKLWLAKPVVPGDFLDIWPDGCRDDDLVQSEPVGTDCPSTQKFEHEARGSINAEFLRQFPGRGLLVRFTNISGTPKHPVVLTRKTGRIVRAAMNKEPSVFVAAHDRGDAMKPALTNRFGSVNDPQHLVLLVDALNQFTHGPHDARGCSRRSQWVLTLACPAGGADTRGLTTHRSPSASRAVPGHPHSNRAGGRCLPKWWTSAVRSRRQSQGIDGVHRRSPGVGSAGRVDGRPRVWPCLFGRPPGQGAAAGVSGVRRAGLRPASGQVIRHFYHQVRPRDCELANESADTTC